MMEIPEALCSLAPVRIPANILFSAAIPIDDRYRCTGGESGIRTLEGLAPQPPFQGGALGLYANSPWVLL